MKSYRFPASRPIIKLGHVTSLPERSQRSACMHVWLSLYLRVKPDSIFVNRQLKTSRLKAGEVAHLCRSMSMCLCTCILYEGPLFSEPDFRKEHSDRAAHFAEVAQIHKICVFSQPHTTFKCQLIAYLS